MKEFLAALLRLARVLIGQVIGIGITMWGGINIPYVNITIGAVITAFFKWLRDKHPGSDILEWVPL